MPKLLKIYNNRLFSKVLPLRNGFIKWKRHADYLSPENQQESPAIADKPARHESLPKLLQFDVPTTLSLTMLADLHAFNCCCVRNPRNPEKLTENSNL